MFLNIIILVTYFVEMLIGYKSEYRLYQAYEWEKFTIAVIDIT